jgi:uncharacterized protein YchJ
MADQHDHNHDHHDHNHVHHEGEETCDDPTHNHHHQHAQVPYVRAEPKIGRNEPCHCGSGKKFKKCHGA